MLHTSFLVEPIDSSRTSFDVPFALMVVTVVIVGLGVLLSASFFRAQQLYGEPLRFLARQSMWVFVGLMGLVTAMYVPLSWLRVNLPWLVLATLVMLSLTFVPGISARYLGARRWIFVANTSFQPSELAKLTLSLYLAHFFARRNGDFSRITRSLLPPAVVVAVFAGVVLLQNDFSTAAFLVLVSLIVFFAAGVPFRHFVHAVLAVVPVTLIGLFSREHRVERLIAFINPHYDPAGSGFQVLSARRALQSGGFWGVGMGAGTRKLGGLPEAHSDFIFAVLAEELGLVGVVLVVALFALIAGRGLYLAWRIEDPFNSLLVFSLTVAIVMQALINIAVVVGMVPATGIPLPFFSAGGSSLLVTLTMCGLLLNASRTSGYAYG